jgi:hypothetical protein
LPTAKKIQADSPVFCGAKNAPKKRKKIPLWFIGFILGYREKRNRSIFTEPEREKKARAAIP